MQFDSSQSVYTQIANDIKKQIIGGKLKAEEKLKSVREYSIIYEVSNLTIHRALQQLEKEEYITTKKGVGSFVNSGITVIFQENEIKKMTEKFICQMKEMGLRETDILENIKKGLEGARESDEERKGNSTFKF